MPADRLEVIPQVIYSSQPQPIRPEPGRVAPTPSRRPRYVRSTHPAPMRVTQRDRAVVQAVHEYRALRREQIQKLFFPGHRTAIRALARLYHHGYLARVRPLIQSGTGDAQAIYLMDRRGADLLAEDGVQVDWRPKDNQVSWLFFEHTLAVNEVRVAVARAATSLGFAIEKWTDESTLRSQNARDYVALLTRSGRRRRVAIVPDGYFVLRLPDGRRASFFLELDRATVSNARWAVKMQAYQEYVRGGHYQRRYQTQALRVLIVTTSPKRLSYLQATADQVQGGPLFWLTTLGAAGPEAIFTKPIWAVAGWKGQHALIE